MFDPSRGYRTPETLPPHPLLEYLDFMVPLALLELRQSGGATWDDVAVMQSRVKPFCEEGDNLLYGGGKTGSIGRLAAHLAEGIAVLSFVEGGIKVFGRHWESLPFLTVAQPQKHSKPTKLRRRRTRRA